MNATNRMCDVASLNLGLHSLPPSALLCAGGSGAFSSEECKMLNQQVFDLSEEISDALHDQEGLEVALISYLEGKLDRYSEKVAFALINCQRHCRNRAKIAAESVARSGAKGVVQ